MSWAGFPDLFSDAAYYQGDYWSPAESSGVIVNTARCNQGAYSETTWGAKQLANVRAQGKDTGHYLFNGNLDHATVGRLWAGTCRKYAFNPATEVLAYDCEDEDTTGTHAWGPDDVAQCQAGFNAAWGSPVPWQSVRVYMNYDVNRQFDWSGLVALGAQLWYARPGGPLDQAFWPRVWAKQDGTFGGVDANGYTKTFAASNGTAKPIEEDDVSYALIPIADGTGTGVMSLTTGNWAGIASPYHLSLLQRAKKNDNSDPMLMGELAIVKGYLDAINPQSTTGGVTDAQITQIASETAAKIPAAPTKFTITGEAAA